MVNSSTSGEPHYSVKILDFALMCVGHHDYEVHFSKMNLKKVKTWKVPGLKLFHFLGRSSNFQLVV